jgi:hypothetical protein
MNLIKILGTVGDVVTAVVRVDKLVRRVVRAVSKPKALTWEDVAQVRSDREGRPYPPPTPVPPPPRVPSEYAPRESNRAVPPPRKGKR